MYHFDRKAPPPTSLDASARDDRDAPAPGRLARIALQRRAISAAPEDSDALRAAVGKSNDSPSSTLPFFDKIQRSFGRHDISAIQCHTGGEAQTAARTLGAEAFATGSHVAFGGAPTLHTAAHEAAHVIQQRAGVHLKGGIGADGDPYERHADEVADRVVRGESAEDLLDSVAGDGDAAPRPHAGAPVQCKRPGDTAPALNQQMDTRLADTGEGGAVPPEGTLLTDVAALLAATPAPAAVTNAAELVAFTLHHFQHSPMAAHTHDLATLSVVLSTVLLTEHANHVAPSPVAALNPGAVIPQVTNAVQPLVRQAVTAWCQANHHPALSNAAIDATYHIDLSGVGDVATGARTRFLADHPMTPGFTGTLPKAQQDQLRAALLEMTTVQRALSGDHHHVAEVRSVGSPAVRNWLRPRVQVDDGSEYGTARRTTTPSSRRAACPAPPATASPPPARSCAASSSSAASPRSPSRSSSSTSPRTARSSRRSRRATSAPPRSCAPTPPATRRRSTSTAPTPSRSSSTRSATSSRTSSPPRPGSTSSACCAAATSKPSPPASPTTSSPSTPATAIARCARSAPTAPTCRPPAPTPPSATRAAAPPRSCRWPWEYLSNPKTAKKLLDKDPLQAAIVLRGIAPQEFNLRVPAPLRALLPS